MALLYRSHLSSTNPDLVFIIFERLIDISDFISDIG